MGKKCAGLQTAWVSKRTLAYLFFPLIHRKETMSIEQGDWYHIESITVNWLYKGGMGEGGRRKGGSECSLNWVDGEKFLSIHSLNLPWKYWHRGLQRREPVDYSSVCALGSLLRCPLRPRRAGGRKNSSNRFRDGPWISWSRYSGLPKSPMQGMTAQPLQSISSFSLTPLSDEPCCSFDVRLFVCGPTL